MFVQLYIYIIFLNELLCHVFFIHFPCLNDFPWMVFIIPILQMRKHKFKEVKYLPKS